MIICSLYPAYPCLSSPVLKKSGATIIGQQTEIFQKRPVKTVFLIVDKKAAAGLQGRLQLTSVVQNDKY